MNESAVKKFEQENLAVFRRISELAAQKAAIEETDKKLRAQLVDAMEKYGIEKLDNQWLSITKVAGSQSTGIDLKAFQKAEPRNYADLLADYPKVTRRAAYVRIEVK